MSEAATQIPPATGWKTFGHDAAVQMLNAANMTGRLSHAYLITGPDGIGRRTLAIDFACLVNCDPQPDLFGDAPILDLASCPAAQRIRNGQHADVRLIDRSTPLKETPGTQGETGSGQRQNISINHIHELQRDAALKPFEGRSRVFIIDGAEELSEAAANALLKTLEEPSEDVYLVLVATDPESLPETIVSRCQRISLRPVTANVIAENLVNSYEADAQEAERLSRLASGRPGWAISALQDPAVLEVYTQTATRILTALAGDLEVRFSYASELAGRFRRDRDSVLAELSRWQQWWRDIAVAKSELPDLVINSDWLAEIQQIAGQLSEPDIVRGADAVGSARTALEANAIPQLALEVMALDMPGAGVNTTA